MPRKKKATKRSDPSRQPASKRVGPVMRELERSYPKAKTALRHENPLQLLVATILSAQCTDARVNMVTQKLFKKYRSAKDYADADPEQFEAEIRPTGFFRNKAKAILGMAQALVERHAGRVPQTMEELVALPGVGRKTANVVLGSAFGKNEGVVVDTHVKRIATRLGFTKHQDPEKIERDLMQLLPRGRWTQFSHVLIHHGRAVCTARRPKCEVCPVSDLCPSSSI